MSAGLDWKNVMIVLLTVIVLIESVTLLVLAFTLVGRKFSVIVDAKVPREEAEARTPPREEPVVEWPRLISHRRDEQMR